MLTIGALGFTAPVLLAALVALPVLWLILRAIPPAPIRRRFPGVALLLGLQDDESQTDRTPWWLLALRMAAVALVIAGFAGPVLNPAERTAGSGPLLVLVDGTWADARDWDSRSARIDAALAEAARDGRPAALVALTDMPPGGPQFQSADAVRARLPALAPQPFAPQPDAVAQWAETLSGRFDTLWLSDGLARDSRAALLPALENSGDVRIFESPRAVLGLRPALFADGIVTLTALRTAPAQEREVQVTAHGLDPAGVERVLATATATFDAGAAEANVDLSLPPELRNRVTRFEIAGQRSAGAVTLTDDGLKRREVALISSASEAESLELLSPLHYLQQALVPTADLIEGTLTDIILANPDAIILADVATVTEAEQDDLLDWMERGGMLVRFAGPRLAASDMSRDTLDPLMPVRLRSGGRSIGGAMSWGEPKGLRPFADGSPFFGLPIPREVSVSAQVMAQPDPDLAGRVVAALEDGTPLVTRRSVGEGQVILFHVTANAEWSTLPLSGLFVQMLERLAISTRSATPEASELAGTTWTARDVLDGFGRVQDAGTLPGIPGEDLVEAPLSASIPPGLYEGPDRAIARNVLDAEATLTPTAWPARLTVEGLDVAPETPLKGWALALALALLMADVIASLVLSGRLRGPRAGATAAVALALLVAAQAPAPAWAQESADEALALRATAEVVLGHVVTGDPALDERARAGLHGLSRALTARTAIEPADPIAVNIEMDELSFFPFLYWPVAADQPIPSEEAYAKLNRYLRGGGMILFDTRDANLGGFGSQTPEGRKLQALARPLDIPPLEPIPQDHVLTRTFYLLQDFPGRFTSRDVWVEAAPADARQIEGMPFRDLNDGVTPIVIGGNDWAGAWATDQRGAPLYPVGRGGTGERQREIAMRFGINLIMHVLTGNYKSDQVHVPALLDRLGQ